MLKYNELFGWHRPEPSHSGTCVRNGQELYKKSKVLIPGATHLFGKRAELYAPDAWPCYYKKAKGCTVWDLDGNKYLDFTMVGIGACALGYADPDINRAVRKALTNGNLCTLNSPLEVQLAETLVELHPWCGMVRYARTGGEMASVAIRIARASTNKNKIIICGYHGWHDWYLSANLASDKSLDGHLLQGLQPNGVPRDLQGLTIPVKYGDISHISHLLALDDDIAAVIMEPSRDKGYDSDFLSLVKDVCRQHGVVLIFDETTSGFRENCGGIHILCGVTPDLCIFGKTISNGIPMAALIGTTAVMEAAQNTFISSTYWTDSTGPAAALAFIKKHKQLNLGVVLEEVGEKIRSNIQSACDDCGFTVSFAGTKALTSFSISHEDWPKVLTLFTQLMIDRGILASDRSYSNYAHTFSGALRKHRNATADVLSTIALHSSKGDLDSLLRSRIKMSSFHRI
jgi:glutamate-1-semialdehyde 2,1-aminomutase